MELSKEYFDKHYEELNDFLSEQFTKLTTQMANGFAQVDERSATLEKKVAAGFAEQSVRLDFIQAEVATLRKDVEALARRTREDDEALNKEMLKLKHRVDTLERQVKVLTGQPA